MKFGIALPHSGPLASVDAIRRIAVEAERLGFESVWVHDHITYDVDWLGHRTSGVAEEGEPIEPNFYEALSTLAHVAGFTTRVRLGTAVIVLPLRDPRVFGRQILSVQALSRDRLTLGVGTGDYPADFRVMQIPYAEKRARTEEYLAALRIMLPGGRFSFQGETASVEEGAFFPITAPVPMLMGGGIRSRPGSRSYELFEPTLRALARWCDGWIPEGPPEQVAQGVARIRNFAREFGRDDAAFEIRPASPLYIGDDSSMARLGRNREFELIGTMATIQRKIAAYREAGADAVNLRCFADDIDGFVAMITRFAHEVMD